MQVALSDDEPDPSVTDCDDGEIEVHADRGCELTVIVAEAAAVPVPPALFAVTVTLYVVAEGRLPAGTMQVDVVQLRVVLPSFHTYDVGLLLQLALSDDEPDPSVTDCDDGEIELHADSGAAVVTVTRLLALSP